MVHGEKMEGDCIARKVVAVGDSGVGKVIGGAAALLRRAPGCANGCCASGC